MDVVDQVEVEKRKMLVSARLMRRRREGVMLGCLAAGALILMVMAFQNPVPPLVAMVAVSLSLTVLGLTCLLFFDLWGRRDADRDALREAWDRDQVQSAEALQVVVMAAFGLLYMTFGVRAAWQIALQNGDLADWQAAVVSLALPAVVIKMILSGKRVQRRPGAAEKDADELTIHFRRSAVTWSFVAALIAMAGVYIAGLINAPLATAGMPVVFEISALTAALRYWWLDRQASRG
ncbi:hypothetical protein [Brevundimonas nasdae]|uniref:Uncharacterized protein n=1 Tax=Brevundimonas nasdae TaxID=172043 RepID=A0ABX8TF17_9CAUL|nr:hypothetical protein [Brevundimonas nasdae]QYC09183.1 hypothetical protein KWG56_11200 [Brevundimonas nasdae]QYC15232.1 hypothetical protein KWG63_06530 [Brevundimonas nasdae]